MPAASKSFDFPDEVISTLNTANRNLFLNPPMTTTNGNTGAVSVNNNNNNNSSSALANSNNNNGMNAGDNSIETVTSILPDLSLTAIANTITSMISFDDPSTLETNNNNNNTGSSPLTPTSSSNNNNTNNNNNISNVTTDSSISSSTLSSYRRHLTAIDSIIKESNSTNDDENNGNSGGNNSNTNNNKRSKSPLVLTNAIEETIAANAIKLTDLISSPRSVKKSGTSKNSNRPSSLFTFDGMNGEKNKEESSASSDSTNLGSVSPAASPRPGLKSYTTVSTNSSNEDSLPGKQLLCVSCGCDLYCSHLIVLFICVCNCCTSNSC